MNHYLRSISQTAGLVCCFLWASPGDVLARNGGDTFLQGYAMELGGKRFAYHSPLPGVTESLLVRGRETFEPIRWQTQEVPVQGDAHAAFIWMFGMDVSPFPATFHLYANGNYLLTFSSSRSSELGARLIRGKSGAELTLNTTMLDRHQDQMGFAILRLPSGMLEAGKPLVLELCADPEATDAWFMTFKTRLQQQTEISQNKVVVKGSEGARFHSVSASFLHLGEAANASVKIGMVEKEMVLQPGFNRMDIHLPMVEVPREMQAEVRIGKGSAELIPFRLEAVKPWEIYLVQHTHSDIGYTRPQTEILPEHLRYIDHALDYCDQTDQYPEAAQFRWTCETSWSVREYLRSRPQQQVDRLLKRIREGRIEATGMFFNFSEIIDEPALAAQTRTLRMLKNAGIDVTTAMQNDVNGIAWCLVDYFQHTDVKYLTMGIHAHRARKPFDKPTSFWWQSPAGNRLLAYRSEHYMHGNMLSLTTGQQDVFRDNLSAYLDGLEEKGYPYDKLSLQFSGYVTDNSPPSAKVCDIIRDWNERYEWPKLRSSLARDFMIYLDETHGDHIPSQEVAWPDWWTDGVASAANETKVARATHVEMAANTVLLSMCRIMGAELPPGIQHDVEEVYDKLLFYDEHTYGASESVRDPLVQNSVNQWNMKSANVWSAALGSSQVQEKAFSFMESALGTYQSSTIHVFNTLNWNRSGLVECFISYEVIPEGADFVIRDDAGREVPVEMYMQRGEGAYYGLWVSDVPSMGFKVLTLHLGERPAEQHPLTTLNHQVWENPFYRLRLDGTRGIVAQIYDKEQQMTLLDEDSLSLGTFIYEQLDNRHELERLTNTNRDTVYRPLGMKRSMIQDLRQTAYRPGPIYDALEFKGLVPVCADERGVTIELRLYHYQKKLELHYQMVKLAVSDPEGVYVAFPFKLEEGRLNFEAQGGLVYPGKNQLAGTSSDWNTIQNFASVKNGASQIVFASKDIPLVHFGDINIGRYYYRLNPRSNHIYSWVLNNYWVTNFKASQEGEIQWTYGITSMPDSRITAASRFGYGERVPLMARVMPASIHGVEAEAHSRSLLPSTPENVLLVNATPSMEGRGVILQFRELEGDHAVLDIRQMLEHTGARSASEVSILEDELGKLDAHLLMEHYETRFIRLDF